MKLRGLVPNFHIHLSVSEDLSSYFPSFANLYCIAETVVMKKQLISNGGRFKPAFVKTDKKQTVTDLC
jgi:hypothetical protein